MKQITIITAFLILSIAGFSQTQKQKDSLVIEQQKINKAIAEIVKNPISDLNKWAYENIPAKQYNDFVQLYNLYIRNKYAEQNPEGNGQSPKNQK